MTEVDGFIHPQSPRWMDVSTRKCLPRWMDVSASSGPIPVDGFIHPTPHSQVAKSCENVKMGSERDAACDDSSQCERYNIRVVFAPLSASQVAS